MLYNLDYKSVRKENENSSFFMVTINETVTRRNCIGDQIGITDEGNMLWFNDYVDIDDKEITDFIRNNFANYQAVKGLIRRLTK